MKNILPAKEAAEQMGVSVGTLANWRVVGFGPKFLKVGRKVVYRNSDIQNFLEACEQSSTTSNSKEG